VTELGGSRGGAATILTSLSGIKLRYTMRLQFSSEADKCTNNIAEYAATLLGLCKLRAISVERCILHTDSKVIACQIEKRMHCQRTYPREISSSGQKNENFFQGFHCGLH
jgi:ribonuclease HI